MRPRYYLLFLVPIWIIALVQGFSWITGVLSLPADIAIYLGAATILAIIAAHVLLVPKFLKYVFYHNQTK